VRRTGSGAAWGSVVAGLASVVALPVAIYVTRFSESYELLHAGFAIPVAGALGILAISLARRSGRRSSLRLDGGGGDGLARTGRILGIAGVCVAAAGLVSLAVYGLLDYVGSRE
jgi:hypothetical protein